MSRQRVIDMLERKIAQSPITTTCADGSVPRDTYSPIATNQQETVLDPSNCSKGS